MSLSQALLPEFTQEMAGLRRVIERIPAGRMDYKPHAKCFSLGDLANHLVEIPGWTVSTLTMDELDLSDPDLVAKRPAPSQDAAGLLRTLDAGVEKALAVLAQTSDATFGENWTLKNEGQALFTMPRATVLRSFVLNHVIHHRAQLGLYLRLLEVPVPALYGPSADEA
ncbi:MAG: DinB superfamily protein [Holophagaceae bacterium]|nr:DinB superfamily protein [Holophagaceae bacterium]